MEVSLLKQARLDKGQSLEDLAADIGCDPAHLGRIERGQRSPNRKIARSLFHHFDKQVPLGSIYDPLFDG